MVYGAHFGRVLHHRPSLTRLNGVPGPTLPQNQPNTAKNKNQNDHVSQRLNCHEVPCLPGSPGIPGSRVSSGPRCTRMRPIFGPIRQSFDVNLLCRGQIRHDFDSILTFLSLFSGSSSLHVNPGQPSIPVFQSSLFAVLPCSTVLDWPSTGLLTCNPSAMSNWVLEGSVAGFFGVRF